MKQIIFIAVFSLIGNFFLFFQPVAAKTAATSARVYSAAIRLSEFMPNPQKDENEWVELYNPTSKEIDLSGYKIDDIEEGYRPYIIPEGTIIGPRSYLVFYFSASRFNNEGDSVRFICPGGRVLDSYSYTTTTRGFSYAKINGIWSQTQTPTLGGPNIIN